LTEGYAPAAPLLTRALELGLVLDVANDDVDRWRWLATGRGSAIVALELWDAESAHAMAAVQAQFARDTGAPVYLQFALNSLATTHLLRGELTAAARLIEEDRLIAEVTGNPPVGYAAMALAAWQGQEAQASELIEATSRAATARGLGRMVSFAAYASSVLDNGLGRHDLARDAAWRAFERDELGYGPLVVPELAEAAARTGDEALVRTALDWLSERTRVTPSEWALGIQARLRGLLSHGDAADRRYRESIAHLRRTPVRVELARAHLLYGEWLRRQRRRLGQRDERGGDRAVRVGIGDLGARFPTRLLHEANKLPVAVPCDLADLGLVRSRIHVHLEGEPARVGSEELDVGGAHRAEGRLTGLSSRCLGHRFADLAHAAPAGLREQLLLRAEEPKDVRLGDSGFPGDPCEIRAGGSMTGSAADRFVTLIVENNDG
jgi:hypothetical protein